MPASRAVEAYASRSLFMQQQFGNFQATELYCPKCKQAQPVREQLLLVLPAGELHDYLCRRCGTSLGQRTVTGPAVRPVQAVQPTPRPGRSR